MGRDKINGSGCSYKPADGYNQQKLRNKIPAQSSGRAPRHASRPDDIVVVLRDGAALPETSWDVTQLLFAGAMQQSFGAPLAMEQDLCSGGDIDPFANSPSSSFGFTVIQQDSDGNLVVENALPTSPLPSGTGFGPAAKLMALAGGLGGRPR